MNSNCPLTLHRAFPWALVFLAACSAWAQPVTPFERRPWTDGGLLYPKVSWVSTGLSARHLACSGANLWAIGTRDNGAGNYNIFSLNEPPNVFRRNTIARYVSADCAPDVTATFPQSYPVTNRVGQAIKIAVDGSGTPWVLTAQGTIWKRDTTVAGEWRQVLLTNGEIGPHYTDLVGVGESVFAVGKNATGPAANIPYLYASPRNNPAFFPTLQPPAGSGTIEAVYYDSGYGLWGTAVAPSPMVKMSGGQGYALRNASWVSVTIPNPPYVFCDAVPWLIDPAGIVKMGYQESTTSCGVK